MMRIFRTKANSQGSDRGYTLAELVVVLTVIAVASSIAIIHLDGLLPKYRLRSAARSVGNSIRWWRSLSVAGDERLTLLFDRASGQYSVQTDRETLESRRLPSGVTFSRIKVANEQVAASATVLLSESGVMAPLELTLSHGEKKLTVIVHPLLNKVEYQ